jgi:glutamine amidotransferase
MCRFIAYKGERILLSDLVTNPANSLINQSSHARERKEPLNGDGFGLGWYVPDISTDPCLFTSVTPAWANHNLRRIASKTESPCIFAHVRAASGEFEVNELNCHPFQFGQYLWMHNGIIGDFHDIKRTLRRELKDVYYHAVHGTTDSEHAFALFLSHLPDTNKQLPGEVLADTLAKTISRISNLSLQSSATTRSVLNFAVTDGRSVVATRFAINNEPASLYLCSEEAYECEDGACQIVSGAKKRFAIIASEPITKLRKQWMEIPEQHLVLLNENLDVVIRKL